MRTPPNSTIHLPLLVAATIVAATSPATLAQELVTDRPDQTESSATVPTGFWQVETGTLYEEAADGDTVSAPTTLLRVGLDERLELRLGWDGWISASGDAPDGIGDGELGAKLSLRPDAVPGPEVAILVGTSVPWGDSGLGSDRFDPAARLAVTHGIGDRASLAWNLGAEWQTEEEGTTRSTLSRALATVAVGFDLVEDLGAFVELFATTPLSASGDEELSFDAGVTWLLAPNLQLDAAAGFALSGPAPEQFLGVGITWRWPR